MTLIHTGNSSGTTGRCDAKCYDATSADCDCCCGGRNHGAGLKQAIDNTREHFRAILKECPNVMMDTTVAQDLLF